MKQAMKLAARVLENLPPMTSEVMQGWIENPTALRDFLKGLAPTEAKVSRSKKRNRYLKEVAVTTLAPTRGSTALVDAGDVFASVSSGFASLGKNRSDLNKTETTVVVYEVRNDGTFVDLFSSFGVDVKTLCLTQGQIKEFVRSFLNLLRQDGDLTFFLFEVRSILYVAGVDLVNGRPELFLKYFYSRDLWNADKRPRLVVPQQAVI